MHKLEGFANEFAYVLPDDLLAHFSSVPALKQLYVTDLGYYPHALHHYVHRDLGTEEWILILCTAGKGTVIANKQEWAVQRGTLVLLPPNQPHTYYASETEPWDIFWVHFRGEHVVDYLPTDGAYSQSSLNENDLSEMTSRFWSMIQTFVGGYSDQASFYVASLLANLLAYLALSNHLAATQRVMGNAYVSQAIQYIYDHINEELNMAQLARHLGISDSYLSRLFRKTLNKSVTTFITETKIKQTCHYLQFTDLPIQQIASQVGYADPFYFSRVFKKSVGISPREFRNQYRTPITQP